MGGVVVGGYSRRPSLLPTPPARGCSDDRAAALDARLQRACERAFVSVGL